MENKELDNTTDEIDESEKDDELEEDVKEIHPIAAAINKLLHRVSSISFSSKKFIPMAAKWQIDQLKDITSNLKELSGGFDKNNQDGQMEVVVSKFFDTVALLERYESSELLELLISSHFLSLFTAFDAFTGELLNAIYLRKSELLKSLNRSMTISDMLKYGDIEDIKLIILQDEIESFRRKSYVEQFISLETRFAITLKKFNNWPRFVECSQRRNLITHCDGFVSDQYITICTNEGYQLPEDLKSGEQLKISIKYLGKSCNLISEVGLKLGQSLWRKLFEDEIAEADEHLHLTQYDYLKQKQWSSAINTGEFSVSLPKYSSESQKMIMLINYIISLKFSENDHSETVEKMLKSVDWSALCPDFRLAEAILKNEFPKAGKLMEQIGKTGDFISKRGYHDWPLMAAFRDTKEFRSSYEKIYKHPFTNELKKTADEATKDSQKEVLERSKELDIDSNSLDAKSASDRKLQENENELVENTGNTN